MMAAVFLSIVRRESARENSPTKVALDGIPLVFVADLIGAVSSVQQARTTIPRPARMVRPTSPAYRYDEVRERYHTSLYGVSVHCDATVIAAEPEMLSYERLMEILDCQLHDELVAVFIKTRPCSEGP
jgi:hypothetical protein